MSSTRVFADELDEKIRPLNKVVDGLREIGLQQVIDLPTIAVVSEQSTGKSSVLESIVGASVLPKSDELSTRVPISIQLIREMDPDFETNAVLKGFEYSPTVKFGDEKCLMDELAAKIQERTNLIAGENFQILNKPIYVGIQY